MTERSTGPEQEGRLTRRNVLIDSALSAAALPIVSATGADADAPRAAPAAGNNGDVDLPVNVSIRRLSLDPRTALLETMREHLGLTGAKKGSEHGQCGIGTMLVGGRRVLICPTLAARGARACHDDRGAGGRRWRTPPDAAGVHRPGRLPVRYCTLAISRAQLPASPKGMPIRTRTSADV
jgi:xanthine dehydrogenase YagT iron-sulfur-binding subunit